MYICLLILPSNGKYEVNRSTHCGWKRCFLLRLKSTHTTWQRQFFWHSGNDLRNFMNYVQFHVNLNTRHNMCISCQKQTTEREREKTAAQTHKIEWKSKPSRRKRLRAKSTAIDIDWGITQWFSSHSIKYIYMCKRQLFNASKIMNDFSFHWMNFIVSAIDFFLRLLENCSCTMFVFLPLDIITCRLKAKMFSFLFISHSIKNFVWYVLSFKKWRKSHKTFRYQIFLRLIGDFVAISFILNQSPYFWADTVSRLKKAWRKMIFLVGVTYIPIF